MSELDKFGVEFYLKALISARMSSPIKRKVSSVEIMLVMLVVLMSHRIEYLEKMYEISHDIL